MRGKESDLIYQTELERVKGDAQKAVEDARENAAISPEEIKNLSSEELMNKMRLWRIWAVALMSLHKKEWDGMQAAEYLFEARDLFTTYYNHPGVKEAARAMKTDPKGHEYQMLAEMYRDKGKYYLYAAGLTGNTLFINKAINSFNEAILSAKKDTSAWAVATMEKEIAKRRKEEKIDFNIFKDAYQIAVSLSPQAGGWDRMAAVSWWYVKESLLAGKWEDLRLGLDNLQKATQELGVNWIKKYPLGEISASLLGISRRITVPGISSDKFQI